MLKLNPDGFKVSTQRKLFFIFKMEISKKLYELTNKQKRSKKEMLCEYNRNEVR